MEIYETWIDLSKEKSDAINVLNFLQDLPTKIKIFVREENSNFFQQLLFAESENISKELFLKALEEAETELIRNINFEREFLYLEDGERFLSDRLARIGFTNSSLQIKAATLNFHWRRVRRRVNPINGIIDFANNQIVKLLRRFFGFLNSMLGSLTSVIPGADGIKEAKEIIESYLGIADE